MRISDVAFRDFPPFAPGVIAFPHVQTKDGETKYGEVHLFAGQNGTGKTRLLSLLAAALGNKKELTDRVPSDNSYGVYVNLEARGTHGIWLSDRGGSVVNSRLFLFRSWNDENWMRLANSGYSSGGFNPNAIVDSAIQWNEANDTLSLAYRGTVRAKEAGISATSTLHFGNLSDHLIFDRDENTLICQSMANLKIQAAFDLMEGSAGNSRATHIMNTLEKTLSIITGRQLSIRVVSMPQVHIRVIWGSNSYRIDHLPDGLRAMIGWLVSIIAKLDAKYPEHPKPLDLPLVILLDEPESHLHPAWQRKLIPAAQMLFPNSQMFIATHSPFVISSVNHNGWIHILKADEKGLVRTEAPRACGQGDSWIEVVEEILGVTEWYDPETEAKLKELKSLRSQVLAGERKFEEFKTMAVEIAKRGESLESMMSREIKQLERLEQSKAVAP